MIPLCPRMTRPEKGMVGVSHFLKKLRLCGDVSWYYAGVLGPASRVLEACMPLSFYFIDEDIAGSGVGPFKQESECPTSLH